MARESEDKRIENGDLARDMITGRKGIVISITKCLTGCDRVSLQPSDTGADKLPEIYSFDYTTVEVLEKHKVKPIEPSALAATPSYQRPGGPPTLEKRR